MPHAGCVTKELGPTIMEQSEAGERTSVAWVIPLVIASALVVGESASAESEIYGYVGANGLFELTNVPTEERFRSTDSHAHRLTHRVSVEEVEEAVERYAWQFRLHPALLLAVIKAESDFNPTVISRAGAVGLMQLIPRKRRFGTVCATYTTPVTIFAVARGTCAICWIASTATYGWRWPRIMRENDESSDIVPSRLIRKPVTTFGR
jgi:hypothetical protein